MCRRACAGRMSPGVMAARYASYSHLLSLRVELVVLDTMCLPRELAISGVSMTRGARSVAGKVDLVE